VLWHFLAGLAVYFGSLSDAQVRATAALEFLGSFGTLKSTSTQKWLVVNDG